MSKFDKRQEAPKRQPVNLKSTGIDKYALDEDEKRKKDGSKVNFRSHLHATKEQKDDE